MFTGSIQYGSPCSWDFNVKIDAIMRTVYQDRCEAQYCKDNIATDLMFADDSAIFDNAEAKNILDYIVHTDQSYGTVYLNGTQIEPTTNTSPGSNSI